MLLFMFNNFDIDVKQYFGEDPYLLDPSPCCRRPLALSHLRIYYARQVLKHGEQTADVNLGHLSIKLIADGWFC